MNRLRKIIIIDSAILFFAIVFLLYTFISFENFIKTPNSNIKKKVYIAIAPNENILSISKKLEKKGLIKRFDWFYYYIRIAGKSRKIKAGIHVFYTNYSPRQTLQELIGKSKNSIFFSIPPGFDIIRISKRLTKNGFDGNKFYDLAHSRKFVMHLLHYNTQSIEGFLGPGDYFVAKDESSEELIKLMFKQFREDYNTLGNFDHINKNLYDKVIIASMIEKEAKINSERPLVASVIYNRLKRNMLLQIDSSVIYGIKHFNKKLTINDLENKNNIYNTYMHKGLPPTPICSPGYYSLQASFDPAKTNYLFFVSKNNDSHVFSTTLKQQNHWIDVYQKGK